MTDQTPNQEKRKKGRLSQSDVPAYSLKDALRVPEALSNQYGKQPTRPLMVAAAMSMSPNSGPFRMLTGAAVAYGLTDGAAQGETIGLTALGRRIVAPTKEGDDIVAKREATLKPRVIREFLQKYDGNRLPDKAIALNVLEEMNVPPEATERAYRMILENSQHTGFLQDISGNSYVNLGAQPPIEPESELELGPEAAPNDETGYEYIVSDPEAVSDEPVPSNTLTTNKRVFISHGKNRGVVNQLKEVLGYGGFEAVVSVDSETTAKPVPEKVMDDMRSCGAGIVHVGADQTFTDAEGTEHQILNSNVLIEIGAALALYGKNFILLVEKGVTLPSNLQGLYEVRYEGSKLDYDATMKLLRSFNEFKSL